MLASFSELLGLIEQSFLEHFGAFPVIERTLERCALRYVPTLRFAPSNDTTRTCFGLGQEMLHECRHVLRAESVGEAHLDDGGHLLDDLERQVHAMLLIFDVSRAFNNGSVTDRRSGKVCSHSAAT